jgi:exodeoxyribonuclease V alpha subunit
MNQKGIQYLVDHGFFSELDIHFARLMARLSGKEDEDVFLAAALVSRATGEGHVCLDLSSVDGRPLVAGESGTDGFVCPRLDEWRKKLDPSSVVGRPGDYRPLILDDRSRLYLYRYWGYENS